MFARVVEFVPKYEEKNEFVKTIKNEVLPILNKQVGFLDLIPLFPEVKNEKAVYVILWTEKKAAERYHKEMFPKSRRSSDPSWLLRLRGRSTALRPPSASTSSMHLRRDRLVAVFEPEWPLCSSSSGEMVRSDFTKTTL